VPPPLSPVDDAFEIWDLISPGERDAGVIIGPKEIHPKVGVQVGFVTPLAGVELLAQIKTSTRTKIESRVTSPSNSCIIDSQRRAASASHTYVVYYSHRQPPQPSRRSSNA
jgi:hypothetical protein